MSGCLSTLVPLSMGSMRRGLTSPVESRTPKIQGPQELKKDRRGFGEYLVASCVCRKPEKIANSDGVDGSGGVCRPCVVGACGTRLDVLWHVSG